MDTHYWPAIELGDGVHRLWKCGRTVYRNIMDVFTVHRLPECSTVGVAVGRETVVDILETIVGYVMLLKFPLFKHNMKKRIG